MVERELREKARQLRREGVTVTQIASELGVSKGSVSNWVRNIQLTEEQKATIKKDQYCWGQQNKGAQTNRENARKQRALYQEQGRIKAQEGDQLHLIGCMLYWAEGAKTKRNAIHFANSDPHMIGLFVRFLRESLHIPDDMFRLQIHCHDADDIERIEQYWVELLQLSPSCLHKTQIKKGSDTRKNRLENGVCAVVVNSSKYTQHIFGAIQEYGGFENPAWLD